MIVNLTRNELGDKLADLGVVEPRMGRDIRTRLNWINVVNPYAMDKIAHLIGDMVEMEFDPLLKEVHKSMFHTQAMCLIDGPEPMIPFLVDQMKRRSITCVFAVEANGEVHFVDTDLKTYCDRQVLASAPTPHVVKIQHMDEEAYADMDYYVAFKEKPPSRKDMVTQRYGIGDYDCYESGFDIVDYGGAVGVCISPKFGWVCRDDWFGVREEIDDYPSLDEVHELMIDYRSWRDGESAKDEEEIL